MPELDKYAFFAKIGYTPHSDGQHQYHRSKARFRIPCCGRRYGKSTMAGRDFEPKLFIPKSRYWIVGPTYDLAEKEFRVIWDDLIVDMGLGRDKRVKKAYNKRSGEMYIEFPWQTRIECRSAEHPQHLVGESLDWVIMSEAAKHKKDTFERFIRPALADRRGGADFPTTPEGFNWLHDLWQLGQNPDIKEYVSWRFPSWDNPVVYPGGREDPEILLLEQTTTPEWFMQEIGADFASFVGKIFPEWDEHKHVKKHTFRPDWPNYITFDWGYTNPLAAVEFQVSPDDKIYIWREHYKSFTTIPDHCQMLRNREHPEGYHLDLGFGDAADPEAAAVVSELLVPILAEDEAKSNWRQGIDLIRSFMRDRPTGLVADEFGTPLEAPAFFVDHSCVNVIREFNNYRSQTNSRGTNVPEFGQKMDDHTLDAIRYGLMHLFELGAKHHLNEVFSANTFNSTPDTGIFTSRDLDSIGSTSGTSGIFTQGGVF